jgi:polysaccharide deacetylase 2 family uncharacterized protein YibQ
LKRWAEIWSSFPSEHKKRFWQGFGSYVLLCAAVLVWVSFNAKNTRDIWQGRIPSASAVIGTAPLGTPDISQPIPDTSKFPPDHVPDTTAPIPVVRNNTQTYDDGNTYVSIIISDMGLSAAMTEQALKELPKGVNLAFSPYAENLEVWLKKAAASSLETLVYMPMESATYPKDDPGPRALSSRLSNQDNEDNLKWVLSQGGGSSGVINLMGSRFLTDRKRLSPVFEALGRKNSLFVEIPGTEKSEAPAIASQNGLPYLAVDMKIDDSTTEQDIRRQLDALEKMAKERGFAIGIADPYPLTFRILKSWSDGLKGRGILLAPLTKVWKNKPHNDGTSQPSQEQLRQP